MRHEREEIEEFATSELLKNWKQIIEAERILTEKLKEVHVSHFPTYEQIDW